MTRMTTKMFVETIIGKNLSIDEMHSLFRKTHPEIDITRDSVRVRLRSMYRSTNVSMVRTGQGNKARYQLISATQKFIELGDANFRTKGRGKNKTKGVWRFSKAELRFCHLHKQFDQLIANISGDVANVG
ncbi:hypothetical protein HZI31_20905 [Serratia fonticola]|uniref:hypothetical protein n=1 Tax=Serratia fonticola TaxID=47917 RepID=UPI0015C600CA|nr:hypothetical protein [Serratia fonticola]NYA45758.1 hypothetical protein [Serratia fonticola]